MFISILGIVFIGVIVAISFAWFNSSKNDKSSWGKKFLIEHFKSSIESVVEVLNFIWEAAPVSLHDNESVFFKKAKSSPVVCEIEVLFNKHPSYDEAKAAYYKLKDTVQTFFDRGLVFPNAEAGEKYFYYHGYDRIAKTEWDQYKYKYIHPVQICEMVLKDRLDMITFIAVFKHKDRVFFSDYFGVSSYGYKQAIKRVNEEAQCCKQEQEGK